MYIYIWYFGPGSWVKNASRLPSASPLASTRVTCSAAPGSSPPPWAAPPNPGIRPRAVFGRPELSSDLPLHVELELFRWVKFGQATKNT